MVSDLASDARVFEARFRIDKWPRITRQVVFNKHARRDEDRRIVLLSYAPVERDVLAILVRGAVAARANQRAIVPERAERVFSERAYVAVCSTLTHSAKPPNPESTGNGGIEGS